MMLTQQPIPFYLYKKLATFGIHSIDQLLKHNYLEIFKYIKDLYPSTSYKTLFGLYALFNNIEPQKLSTHAKQDILSSYKAMSPLYTPLDVDTIHHYMDLAHKQSDTAFINNEIPIGAVVVCNNEVIGYAHNRNIYSNTVIAHAEIEAIQMANKALRTVYLNTCDLYVTIEPCLMCAGAIIESRIKRVIFGNLSPKNGAVKSQYAAFDNTNVNHHTQAIGPIYNEGPSFIIGQFLRKKSNV